jgi:hypothetical protein
VVLLPRVLAIDRVGRADNPPLPLHEGRLRFAGSDPRRPSKSPVGKPLAAKFVAVRVLGSPRADPAQRRGCVPRSMKSS